MRKLFILLLLVIIVFTGCTKSTETNKETTDFNKEITDLQSKVEALTEENKDLKSQIDILTAENDKLKIQVTPTVAAEEMTSDSISSNELEVQLSEQPMCVISTDYLIQSEDYKTLYPDMLNAVIQNNSGTDIKNVVVAFAAWDENNLPVKIVGQFDFDDGSYVKQCDFGDVNMVDGSTYGEDKGMSLSEKCDNIKKIKAIVMEYTDFDGNKWSNPYYDAWLSIYEDKKLVE